MSTSDLSPEVVRFLGDHIDSVEQFEVLLLLRTQPDRAWTAAQLAYEMRSTESSSATRLVGLIRHQLVTRDADGAHRYAPADPATDAVVGAAASAYVTRRYTVIEAIFAGPQDKLRVFSDAFRFRKKGDDNG